MAFLYISLFFRGGGLNKTLSKYMGVWLTRRGRLTRANTVNTKNATILHGKAINVPQSPGQAPPVNAINCLIDILAFTGALARESTVYT